MNRGYTAESYLELLERARRIVPDIQIAGDFIVGFPTETEEDYAADASSGGKGAIQKLLYF